MFLLSSFSFPYSLFVFQMVGSFLSKCAGHRSASTAFEARVTPLVGPLALPTSFWLSQLGIASINDALQALKSSQVSLPVWKSVSLPIKLIRYAKRAHLPDNFWVSIAGKQTTTSATFSFGTFILKLSLKAKVVWTALSFCESEKPEGLCLI